MVVRFRRRLYLTVAPISGISTIVIETSRMKLNFWRYKSRLPAGLYRVAMGGAIVAQVPRIVAMARSASSLTFSSRSLQ